MRRLLFKQNNQLFKTKQSVFKNKGFLKNKVIMIESDYD